MPVLQNTGPAEAPVIVHAPAFFYYLRKKAWVVLAGLLAGGGLGAALAYQLPEEYNSAVQILPEIGSSTPKAGGLNALADLTGVSLGMMSNSEAVRPDLYPNVLKSTPFLLKLSSLRVLPKDRPATETLTAFLARHQHRLLPFGQNNRADSAAAAILSRRDSLQQDIVILNALQTSQLQELRERLSASYDKKSGIIVVDVRMPDPIVAAQVAEFSTNYLIDYMLRYRSGKQAEEVEFLEKQMGNARGRFYAADRAVKSYKDRNRNPFFSISNAEETRLQSEVSIAQGLYTSLASQYEQARLKLRQEAPVLKILDPPTVPLKRSSPNRPLIMLEGALVGAALALLLLFVRMLARS